MKLLLPSGCYWSFLNWFCYMGPSLLFPPPHTPKAGSLLGQAFSSASPGIVASFLLLLLLLFEAFFFCFPTARPSCRNLLLTLAALCIFYVLLIFQRANCHFGVKEPIKGCLYLASYSLLLREKPALLGFRPGSSPPPLFPAGCPGDWRRVAAGGWWRWV